MLVWFFIDPVRPLFACLVETFAHAQTFNHSVGPLSATEGTWLQGLKRASLETSLVMLVSGNLHGPQTSTTWEVIV